MIYTSYFGRLRKLKAAGIVPVAVCRGVPDWFNGYEFSVFAPSWDEIKDMQENGASSKSAEKYRMYLESLDRAEIIEQLNSLGDVALVCWETPDKFCHRQLIAEWLGTCEEWEE